MKITNKLKEHGSFTFEKKGQLIISRAYDAWNKETAQSMCSECLKLAQSIKDKPWAILVDLTQWEFGTPDMWEPIEELNQWANKNNQKFEAVVCSLNIQQKLLEKSHEIFTEVNSQFFKTENDALQWLKSNGIE